MPIATASGAGVAKNYYFRNGGEGWIRTSVRLRGQIYSLLPLTTRPPLHEACHAQTILRMVEHGEAGAPCGGASLACQRAPLAGVPVAPRFARALQISTDRKSTRLN